MVNLPNPALHAFLAEIPPEKVFGQVLISPMSNGFELRHVQDRGVPGLRRMSVEELRALAQATASGAFRPLKSAPNLQRGWVVEASSAADLGRALDHLYPGALPDWFAARAEQPPVTHYREFTARQTGMYRITQMLSDAQAAEMIGTCCAARFCLKRRLWSVASLDPDVPQAKSDIPCLEPCAMLLEFARKAVRIEHSGAIPVQMTLEDLEMLRESLAWLLDHPPDNLREADFGAPLNARRLHLTLAKLDAMSPPAPPEKSGEK
jgi:hypothetical protein